MLEEELLDVSSVTAGNKMDVVEFNIVVIVSVTDDEFVLMDGASAVVVTIVVDLILTGEDVDWMVDISLVNELG